MKSTSPPKISIVIGTYNQRDRLERVMNSFKFQSAHPSDYELIVVDSTSTDSTAELLRTFQPDFHYQYVIQPNQGKASARNKGVSIAKAPIIMITDADMIADRELVKAHITAHETAIEPTSFEGVTLNMANYNWPPDEGSTSPYIRKAYPDGARLGWYYFLTGNISFSKTLFDAHHGFDETFTGYGWEDLELGYRLYKAGIPHRYLKSAVNYHYHVLDAVDEIDRNVAKGKSARYFIKKHPELKYFLGMNPISIFLFTHVIRPNGRLISTMKRWVKLPQGRLRKRFAIWFLSEYRYLEGVLDKR